MTAHWDTVAIVGVGMIGGSIGHGLLKRKLARRVIGIGRNPERLETAEQNGAVSEVTTSLSYGVSEADLTVICTPVETIADICLEVAEHCPTEALITDAGSTKSAIIESVGRRSQAGRAPFVGSHPLAGSERAGVIHADADLLVGRVVVVTPGPATNEAACRRVTDFWGALDARVTLMSPDAHDQAIAATSHLPHALASLLAATTPEELLPLVGTGWLDTTRVAAGDAELWRQILMQNRPSVLSGLREFGNVLDSFADALDGRDQQAVLNLLTVGKQRRDAMAD